MKKWVCLIIILFFAACGNPGNMPISELEQQNLDQVQILDVRTPEEYDLGHLDQAVNINWYDAEFKEKVAALPRDKTVYVYCKAGGRSAKAASIMREMGFKEVVNLEGGYDAYVNLVKQ